MIKALNELRTTIQPKKLTLFTQVANPYAEIWPEFRCQLTVRA